MEHWESLSLKLYNFLLTFVFEVLASRLEIDRSLLCGSGLSSTWVMFFLVIQFMIISRIWEFPDTMQQRVTKMITTTEITIITTSLELASEGLEQAESCGF